VVLKSIQAKASSKTSAGAQPCGPGKVYLIYFDPTDTTHYPNLNDPTKADTVSLSLVGKPGPLLIKGNVHQLLELRFRRSGESILRQQLFAPGGPQE